ncbi:hypothetical protein NMY3_01859 [Candidatus Nitrosocosmicus oleophilus]|uniref:Telomeric repeat-binding factor 2 n=1 Tax=Candidatus Nitrosocosmicus oleophilus TaxID=1353260 RepID=A0A654M980_9ARCH|nr:hypothetical protein [Candidatus Nitrosocosmicus oleophilus]ALI36062.1 hypothetical protein NMY3_01859 [Candidatus Nitrosocosmicus oleophilus]
MNIIRKSFILIPSVLLVFIFLLDLTANQINSQEQGMIYSLSSTIVNLELKEIEVGESPTGLISVKGTAINNSTFDVRDVKVLVELFDHKNTTVSETSRFITPPSSTFKPGYERDFYFFVSANNVDHYKITAEGEKIL